MSVNLEMPIDYHANGDGTGSPIYDNRSSVRVKFVRQFVVNTAASILEGKEVLKEEIVILKQAPKDTNQAAHRATSEDKIRYAKEWQAFERTGNGSSETALGQLYGISSRQIEQLAFYDCMTIESLAKLGQEHIAAIVEGEKLQALAKVWLEARSGEKESAGLLVLAETYKKRSDNLEEENKKLRAQLASAKPKRKPARKKSTVKKKETPVNIEG